MMAVAPMAAVYMPPPTASPIPATDQRLAAVVRPRTTSPRRSIDPAPRKPIAETTWAATRDGSSMTFFAHGTSAKPNAETRHERRADANEHVRAQACRPVQALTLKTDHAAEESCHEQARQQVKIADQDRLAARASPSCDMNATSNRGAGYAAVLAIAGCKLAAPFSPVLSLG